MLRINWLHLALIVVIAAGALTTPAAAQIPPAGPSVVPDELIVRLHPSLDPQQFAAANGLALQIDGRQKVPGRPIYRFTIVDGSTPAGKMATVARRAGVVYAEPNYEGQIPQAQKRSSWAVGNSEGEYVAQWAGERIGLPRAHAVSRGAGVLVAILDTGVDLSHPALAGRLVPGYDFVDGDSSPAEEDSAEAAAYADAEGEDQNGATGDTGDTGSSEGSGGSEGSDEATAVSAYGHGTHVAGLVALAAPDALILPVRTLDAQGRGDLWTQVLAMRYAAYRGADVINLSFTFGGQRSTLFDDVVAEVSCTARGFVDCRALRRPGAVVVAAAGNGGTTERLWPAASALPGVLAVAASTEQDGLASFSSYGSWVPLAAPGDRVTSAIPPGAYEAWSGTSMAAPLTAGVSALVRSAHPGLPPADVIRRIVSSATVIEAPVRRRLDAAAAVAPIVTPTVTPTP